MDIKRMEISLLVAFVMLVFIGQITAFAEDSDNIRENTLRLHIMADSNSEKAQKVKLYIRDFVLNKYGNQLANSENLNSAKENTANLLYDMESDINAELNKMGEHYKAKCELCNMYFSTRYYDNFTMAAGEYDALRITLGKGEGKNWWCVMYPPLCLGSSLAKTTATEKEIYKTSEEFAFIPKFAAIEIWQSLKNKKQNGIKSKLR